jgi:hypothetical protein
MPENCVANAGVVTRPLIDPEIWREVNLVTVRGRPHSPAVAALVKEATRIDWRGRPDAAGEHAAGLGGRDRTHRERFAAASGL